MNKAHYAVALLITVLSITAVAQNQTVAPPQGGPPQPEFIQQGNQLARDGKLQEALDIYQKRLIVPADAFAANIASGNTLD